MLYKTNVSWVIEETCAICGIESALYITLIENSIKIIGEMFCPDTFIENSIHILRKSTSKRLTYLLQK